MSKLIDGRALASALVTKTAASVASLKASGIEPALAVILVGEEPASEIYVRRKIAKCRECGISSVEHRLPATVREAALLDLLDRLNCNPQVHGILVQLPLPSHIDEIAVMDRIDPAKDVDGFHPVNVGRLSIGTKNLVPCTPLGIMMLLDSVIDDYRGRDAVVIGKSNIVGKPVAMLLLERGATVTIAHAETLNITDLARKADILVAATGVPRLVRGFWIKPGAVVIDVGITREIRADGTSGIVGDCATDELAHASAVTPVPGGVGPMTIACLLANTVKAAERILHD